MNNLIDLHQYLLQCNLYNKSEYIKAYRYCIWRLHNLGYSIFYYGKHHGVWLELYTENENTLFILRTSPDDSINKRKVSDNKHNIYVKNRNTNKAVYLVNNSDYDIMFMKLIKKIWELKL